MNPWRNFYESLGVTAEPDSVLGFGDVWGLASSPEHLIRAYWDCPWNFLPLTSSPFLDLWKIYLWHWQSSVQLRSCVQLFATPWTAACQASLSITNSWSLPKLRSIESVMPSNHLILCCPLLPPSIFPSIRVFSNESALHIRWPKYWSFSFSISPSNEYSGLISFRMDWFDLLAVQETKASILQHSAFCIVQLSHPYMTTGKTIALMLSE